EDTQAELAAIGRQLEAMARDEAAGLLPDEDAKATVEERQAELTATVAQLEEKVAGQRKIVERIDDLRGQIAAAIAPPPAEPAEGKTEGDAAGEAAAEVAPKADVEALRASLREELESLRAIKAE